MHFFIFSWVNIIPLMTATWIFHSWQQQWSHWCWYVCCLGQAWHLNVGDTCHNRYGSRLVEERLDVTAWIWRALEAFNQHTHMGWHAANIMLQQPPNYRLKSLLQKSQSFFEQLLQWEGALKLLFEIWCGFRKIGILLCNHQMQSFLSCYLCSTGPGEQALTPVWRL